MVAYWCHAAQTTFVPTARTTTDARVFSRRAQEDSTTWIGNVNYWCDVWLLQCLSITASDVSLDPSHLQRSFISFRSHVRTASASLLRQVVINAERLTDWLTDWLFVCRSVVTFSRLTHTHTRTHTSCASQQRFLILHDCFQLRTKNLSLSTPDANSTSDKSHFLRQYLIPDRAPRRHLMTSDLAPMTNFCLNGVTKLWQICSDWLLLTFCGMT